MTEVKPLQPEKAPTGIRVTFSPMVKVKKLVMPLKTDEPIDVQFVALNTTDVRLLKPKKACSGILVTFSPMVKVERFGQNAKTE